MNGSLFKIDHHRGVKTKVTLYVYLFQNLQMLFTKIVKFASKDRSACKYKTVSVNCKHFCKVFYTFFVYQITNHVK